MITMRYRVKDILRYRYKLSEHEINMALIGRGNELSEAYREGIAPEAVAESIYNQYQNRTWY